MSEKFESVPFRFFYSMKKSLVFVWLTLLLLCIGSLFWYNEWVYNLPTAIPDNYRPVAFGTKIDNRLVTQTNNNILFLHFFNPDCPCSRFNMRYFKSLVSNFEGRVNFAIVVLNNKKYSAQQIQHKYDLQIPVYFDSTIAANCGVYSTPQAAIIDKKGKLYYRGNYNRTRYCSDKKTNYAEIALQTLLSNRTPIQFSPLALKAYGCSLPNCTQLQNDE